SESGGVLDLGDIKAAIQTVSEEAHRQQPGSSSQLTPGPEHGTPCQGRRVSGKQENRPPHDLDDEQVPGDRFSDPTFQQAFNDSKAVAANLRRVLASSDLHLQPSSAMARLHRTAVELEGFRPPATRVVGFVGDSGVGKSSLLNSLLDMEGLARTSNEGAACTCVATEYHYHDREDFIIDIQLFTEDEVNRQISDLLKSYRHFFLRRHQLHHSEVKDFENRAAQAVDTFVAMFGRRIERPASGNRSSNVGIPSLLGSDSSRILKQLQEWARESIATGSGDTRVVLSTSGACSDELAKLTSEAPGRSSQLPWPFIRRIKVFVKANILGRGLILVDLPGLRDLNKARRNIAERYLVDVDEIFAICNIGRATTDEGVQAVFELAARAKLSNVGIICTRSDDIRPEEAVRSWSGSVQTKIQDKIDDVKQAQENLADIKSNVEDFEDDEENLSDAEKAELMRLRKQEKTAGLQKLVVDTRNAKVKKSLYTAYQDRVPSGTLQVFCVSNSLYWQRRRLSRLHAMPTLLLSGIMAIREHCRAKVSDTQYRLCLEYMQDSIPALLGEVGLWVSSSEAGSMDAERRRVLRQGLSSLENQLRRASTLMTLSSSLRRDLRDNLISPRLRIAAWTQSASAASNEWGGWHHSSYSAFCRNYGDYHTKTIGTRCWNVEATEDMAQDSEPIWQALLVAMDQRLDSLVAVVDNALVAAIELLAANLDNLADVTLPLRSALVSIKHLLEAELDNLIDGFNDKMRKLRIDASSGIRTSLVGEYMEPFYREAIYESAGAGSDARRKRCVGGGFRSRELFDSVLDGVKAQFSESADSLQSEVVGSVQEHVDRVREALGILLTDNAAREGDENPAFRQAVGHCLGSAQSEMRRVRSLVSAEV
ncbi:hypothetical protein Micbo1qcDRAFT_128158, partial [Microdochium bolleyi]